MSATQPAPAPAGASQARATLAAGEAEVGGLASPQLPAPAPSRTPRLYRRLQLLAGVAVVVPSVLAGWTLADLGSQVTEVPPVVAQFDRLAKVQRAVIEAGNQTGLAVISGGSVADRLEAGEPDLSEAAGLLAEANAAGTGDPQALQDAAAELSRYAVQLGATAGADAKAAFVAADTGLDPVLVPIAATQDALLSAPAADGWPTGSILLVIAAVLSVAALIWISWMLAVRSHRVVNLGVAGAALAVAAVLGVTLNVQGAIDQAAGTGRDEELGRVASLGSGSTALATARRVQVNAVVRQRWDAAAQDAYEVAFGKVRATASADPKLPPVAGLEDAQAGLAEQLSAKDWSAAAKLLADREGELATEAAAYWQANDAAAAEAVAAATVATGDVSRQLPWQLGLIGLLGLAGTLLALLGVGQRIKEYQ